METKNTAYQEADRNIALAIARGRVPPEVEAWLEADHTPAEIAASPVVRLLAEIRQNAARGEALLGEVKVNRKEEARILSRLSGGAYSICRDDMSPEGIAYNLVFACEGKGDPARLAAIAAEIGDVIATATGARADV